MLFRLINPQRYYDLDLCNNNLTLKFSRKFVAILKTLQFIKFKSLVICSSWFPDHKGIYYLWALMYWGLNVYELRIESQLSKYIGREKDIELLFHELSVNHNIYKVIIDGKIWHIDNNKNLLSNYKYIEYIKQMYSIERLRIFGISEPLCNNDLNNHLQRELNINNINKIRRDVTYALSCMKKQNIFITNIDELDDIYCEIQLQNIPMLTLSGIEIIIDIKKCLDNIKVLHILDCTGDARKLFMPIIKKIKT